MSEGPSLTEAIAPLAAGAHVTALTFLGETAALALGDGGVLLARDGETRRVAAHPEGAILAALGDGRRLVTGGDDGRVVATDAAGESETLAETANGAWVDALALHGDGSVAYASGRRVAVRDAKTSGKNSGREKIYEAPSTARGLAFAPKGFRLAIAHYGGATVWFPNLQTAPELLDWKGSHIDAAWSPDGRFVVTSMQENALHGWRLQPDRGHMRMSGYPAKVRSIAWAPDGKWLATSGAEAVIAWPFDSKEGPMGKQPRELGARPARVSRVAYHPRAPVLAAGYEDGCILLLRFNDASELLVRRATPASGVTALAWDRAGQRLGFGCADGQGGLLRLPE